MSLLLSAHESGNRKIQFDFQNQLEVAEENIEFRQWIFVTTNFQRTNSLFVYSQPRVHSCGPISNWTVRNCEAILETQTLLHFNEAIACSEMKTNGCGERRDKEIEEERTKSIFRSITKSSWPLWALQNWLCVATGPHSVVFTSATALHCSLHHTVWPYVNIKRRELLFADQVQRMRINSTH